MSPAGSVKYREALIQNHYHEIASAFHDDAFSALAAEVHLGEDGRLIVNGRAIGITGCRFA